MSDLGLCKKCGKELEHNCCTLDTSDDRVYALQDYIGELEEELGELRELRVSNRALTIARDENSNRIQQLRDEKHAYLKRITELKQDIITLSGDKGRVVHEIIQYLRRAGLKQAADNIESGEV